MTYPYAKNDVGKHTSKQHSIQVTLAFFTSNLLNPNADSHKQSISMTALLTGQSCMMVLVSPSAVVVFFEGDEGVDATS